MKQQLLPYPLARDKDPMTSHIAAEKMVNSGKLNQQENDVYHRAIQYVAYFRNPNDFTAKEISAGSAIDYYTVQRRLSGLRNKGKIERLNTEGGAWVEGQELMKRDGCCVWRLK